jgi:hypothetical protein
VVIDAGTVGEADVVLAIVLAVVVKVVDAAVVVLLAVVLAVVVMVVDAAVVEPTVALVLEYAVVDGARDVDGVVVDAELPPHQTFPDHCKQLASESMA